MTFYAESGKSHAHSMSPWTKAVLLAIVVLMVIIARDLYVLLALWAAVMLFYAVARLPLRLLVGWYTLPILFVLTISVMFMFNEPGNTIASAGILGGTIRITDNGILLVVKLMVRALAVVTFSIAVFMTTKYSHVAHMSTKILPKPLANIFLLSYRFNFETSDEMSDVLDAMRSRNGDLVKGVTSQTRLYAGIFGLAFVHAFERAERIAKAMEARGFSGTFLTDERLPRPAAGGYALIVTAVAVLAIVTYSRYFSNLIGWW